MTKALLPLAIVAALGVAGCSEKAQNEAATAANTMSADANATMARAVNSTDAAFDKAVGAAENSMDKIDNTAADARKKAGQAAHDIGNDIED